MKWQASAPGHRRRMGPPTAGARSALLGTLAAIVIAMGALLCYGIDGPCLDDRLVAAARRLQSSAVASDASGNDPGYYDHLVIHYHKTGHDLAHSLVGLIKRDESLGLDVHLNPMGKRAHDETTKCPRVDLDPGTIHVQVAPDFLCDINMLAEELLHGKGNKRGIKIVHLVRNPFRMAASNYRYHSQDPTPEKWVKGYRVCREEESPLYPELLMPTLAGAGIVNQGDFDAILDLCRSLFQTRPGLERSDFYTHLRQLDPAEGLLLATTHQLRGRIGDIARMVNNILKLRQLQLREDRFNMAHHHLERRIQVLTMTPDQFRQNQGETALRFLDFLLGDAASQEAKFRMAVEYEREYLDLVEGKHHHITASSGGQHHSMLESALREHELLGRILGNVERVVGDAVGRASK